jgi:hypothetical protein
METPNFIACLDNHRCQWDIDSGSSVNAVSVGYIKDLLPGILSPESTRSLTPCFDEIVDLKGNKAREIAFLDLFYSSFNGVPSFSLNKEGNAIGLTVLIIDAKFESFVLGTPFFELIEVRIKFPLGANLCNTIRWCLRSSTLQEIIVEGSITEDANEDPIIEDMN